jgi:uncharacterized membrane protein YkvI
MRTIAVVAISLVAVIALLDVAASFAINGSVDVPFLLVLVVAAAILVQLTSKAKDVRRDVATLLRLQLHLEALERYTAVLKERYPSLSTTPHPREQAGPTDNRLLS